MDGTTVANFGDCGIVVGGGTPQVSATVRHSTIRDNGNYGVYAVGSSVVRLDGTTITGNATGVGAGAGSAVLSRGNNTIEGNGVDGVLNGTYPSK